MSFDADRLAARVRDDGCAAAEVWLGRALEQMAFSLSRIERLRKCGRLDACATQARDLRDVAARCGLAKLSSVAGSVARCAETGDATALAATAARLSRVGDQSFSEIWNTSFQPA